MNLEDLRARLVERWEGQVVSHQDVLSAAMYPKVFDEYKYVRLAHVHKHTPATHCAACVAVCLLSALPAMHVLMSTSIHRP